MEVFVVVEYFCPGSVYCCNELSFVKLMIGRVNLNTQIQNFDQSLRIEFGTLVDHNSTSLTDVEL